MSDLETYLREVEARERAATAGPWHLWQQEWVVGPIPSSDDREYANEGVAYTVGSKQLEDSTFIAHARTDVTALRRIVEIQGRQLQALLNKVNVVTAHHRHGSTLSAEMLDDLSNRQIEVEQAVVGIESLAREAGKGGE